MKQNLDYSMFVPSSRTGCTNSKNKLNGARPIVHGFRIIINLLQHTILLQLKHLEISILTIQDKSRNQCFCIQPEIRDALVYLPTRRWLGF